MADITIGQILWWSGTLIPESWQICDGTNGTPDLRGKFIYGKTNDAETPTEGGSSAHVHTSTTVYSDYGGISHNHGGSAGGNSSIGGNTVSKSGYNVTIKFGTNAHTHSLNFTIGSDGFSHRHSINLASASALPPYILLYQIMKVG